MTASSWSAVIFVAGLAGALTFLHGCLEFVPQPGRDVRLGEPGELGCLDAVTFLAQQLQVIGVPSSCFLPPGNCGVQERPDGLVMPVKRFERIRTGQIKLPRFQRFEAWTYGEVTGLLETVLRGLPAGATLILEVGESELFVSRTMIGAPGPFERCTEHLLDGQQRLTALWRSLNDDYPDRTYFVRMLRDDADEQGGETAVAAQSRWTRKGVRYPVWADQPRRVWARGLVPIRLLRPGDLGTEIQDWCDLATKDVDQSRQVERLIRKLREDVMAYNIPYLSLPVTTPKDVALEVFIKMNTSAVRLSAFDIVVAQLEEVTGQSLHDLISSLQLRVPNAERYRDLGTWVLDVASLREDRPPTQASYQRLDLAKLEKDWDEIVEGIEWAVSLLEDERVFDAQRLPTVAVLAILAALHASVPIDPDSLGNARTVLRAYMWRAFLTQRYEQQAGSRSLQDFRGLRDALAKGASLVNVPIFDEDAHPLPDTSELRAAGWPRNREILARGILALSLRASARDLADDTTVTRASVRTREYHHLFPHSVLTTDAGLEPASSFRTLNCVLITWRTNRKIAAKSPLRYLRERIDRATLGEPALRSRLASHLVPYEELAEAGWENIPDPAELNNAIRADYERFLDARAELMRKPIRDLCDGHAPTEVWIRTAATS